MLFNQKMFFDDLSKYYYFGFKISSFSIQYTINVKTKKYIKSNLLNI